MCCAAAISGDGMQDLKAGHLLGSTPILLQVMQIVGLFMPSLTIAPIISLLVQAYGIGDKTAEFPNALPAPQASLIKAVTESIFFGGKRVALSQFPRHPPDHDHRRCLLGCHCDRGGPVHLVEVGLACSSALRCSWSLSPS